ncbi:manganese efflux pump MntP family protein [Pseudalkalibacillus caeni]|uniref:Putative manganese efflux pump MntP n=1 Tax=Exobacillus caeni TaxID=2574798 RepID=A0A5R9EZQ5_9BACL|nr:manganese efflux pump MntP family protein [Pseudalkalibacillus caeni]TLS36717.1 manganese efflux pump [Pseudalkalibacillus caeni]
MEAIALVGELITLSIMAFALGMDAFSVGLGMGMLPLRLKQIAKIGVVIGLFHMLMPLGGMLIGHFISEYFGAIATLVGGTLLLLLGFQMIVSSFDKNEEPFVTPVGFGMLVFAVSVSLDSFSVGLSLGIYGARMLLTICLFGFFSMILTWAGLLMGRKFQHWLGSYSELLGGSILLGFGIKLLI